jgi:hypothetical protein
MGITAEKPVTREEFNERMAIAKSYGPQCVANLAAEFRRRNGPDPFLSSLIASESPSLQKCGLEVATGGVEDSALKKRLEKRRTKLQMATHSGPPTKEEIAELLLLDAAPGEDFSGIVAEVLAGKTVTKSYTPTQAQIAQHDDLLINSAGF